MQLRLIKACRMGFAHDMRTSLCAKLSILTICTRRLAPFEAAQIRGVQPSMSWQ